MGSLAAACVVLGVAAGPIVGNLTNVAKATLHAGTAAAAAISAATPNVTVKPHSDGAAIYAAPFVAVLLAVAIAAIVPFVAAASYGATRIVFAGFGRRAAPVRTISADQEQRILARINEYPEQYRAQIREHLERRLAAARAARAAALGLTAGGKPVE